MSMDIKAGKRKIRISLFDIVIIILIIVLAAGFVVLKNKKAGNADMKELTYQIEITGLNESFEGTINKGDKFIDKVKKFEMGEVADVTYSPDKDYAYDNTSHRKVCTEVPGRIAAYITMKAMCTDDGSSIKTDGGMEIAVGTAVSIIGPGYSGAGYIISMDRGDN